MTLGEDDRFLDNLAAGQAGAVRHFDLERIAVRTNRREIDRFQSLASIDSKSAGSVMYRNPRNSPNILIGAQRKKDTPQRPVNHRDTVEIARTKDNVSAAGNARDQIRHRLGIVGEVGVHLANGIVAMFERPGKSCDIGAAEAFFALPVHDKNASVENGCEMVGNLPCPIRRIIVYNEKVEIA